MLQPNASSSQGWLLYGFVGNNPSTFTDPSGMSPFVEYVSNTVQSRAVAVLQFQFEHPFAACLIRGLFWAAGVGAFTGDVSDAAVVAFEGVGCSTTTIGRKGAGLVDTPEDPAPTPARPATPNATNSAPAIKAGASDGVTAGERFPTSVRNAALEENPSTCVYCRMETDAPQVDHAIPRSRGGDATLPNAQTTCGHCNASKGARDFPVTPPSGYRGPWPPPWWDIGG